MGDSAVFDEHFSKMERCFRATRNPAVIAQIASIAKRAVAAGRPPGAGAQRLATSPLAQRSNMLDAIRGLRDLPSPTDRAGLALRLLLAEVSAEAGFLYILRDGELELAAGSSHVEPSCQLRLALLSSMQQAQRSSMQIDEETEALDSSTAQSIAEGSASSGPALPTPSSGLHIDGERTYQCVLLRTRGSLGMTVVAGVIVELKQQAHVSASFELTALLAEALRPAAAPLAQA
jgi:hypothetical protein